MHHITKPKSFLRATPCSSVVFFLCLLTTTVLLSAQTAEDELAQEQPAWRPSTATEIETLLGTNTVTYAQAARFVLEASDTMTTAVHEEAFSYAQEQGWLPRKVKADDTARLDGVALLLMRSFNLKGGLLYSLDKNPRYAYRELKYMDVIQGRADPGMKVSGEKLLFITGRILSRVEK